MKKTIIVLLSSLLVLLTSVSSVIAEPADIDVNIKIEEVGNTIEVEIPDDSIYEDKKPNITVNTPFEYAKVECNGVVVKSTIDDGKVTFKITSGNKTYVISETNAPHDDHPRYRVPNTGVN